MVILGVVGGSLVWVVYQEGTWHESVVFRTKRDTILLKIRRRNVCRLTANVDSVFVSQFYCCSVAWH